MKVIQDFMVTLSVQVGVGCRTVAMMIFCYYLHTSTPTVSERTVVSLVSWLSEKEIFSTPSGNGPRTTSSLSCCKMEKQSTKDWLYRVTPFPSLSAKNTSAFCRQLGSTEKTTVSSRADWVMFAPIRFAWQLALVQLGFTSHGSRIV